jgi:hypothetical protein
VLCARARAAAAAGDLASARGWVDRTRTIAAHVLDGGADTVPTPIPTLDALFTARSLDAKAARAERDMPPPTGDVQQQWRSVALNHAYLTVIWPEVAAAAERRKHAEAEAITRVADAGDGMIAQARRRANQAMDAQDAELAAALIVRYAALRERTLLAPGSDRTAASRSPRHQRNNNQHRAALASGNGAKRASAS